MLAWVVISRPISRQGCRPSELPSPATPPQQLGLLRFPYFPTSLLPYFTLGPSRDEKLVTTTPLDSALTNCDVCKPFRICSYEGNNILDSVKGTETKSGCQGKVRWVIEVLRVFDLAERRPF